MSRQFDRDGHTLTLYTVEGKQWIQITDGETRFVAMPLATFLELVEDASWGDGIFAATQMTVHMDRMDRIKPVR